MKSQVVVFTKSEPVTMPRWGQYGHIMWHDPDLAFEAGRDSVARGDCAGFEVYKNAIVGSGLEARLECKKVEAYQ